MYLLTPVLKLKLHFGCYINAAKNEVMSSKKFIHHLFTTNSKIFNHFTDKEAAQNLADNLYDFLFASYSGKCETPEKLEEYFAQLKNRFAGLLSELISEEQQINQQVETFFDELPVIYESLMLDADAFLEFDPAAQSLEEVLLAYPGFYAISIYRMAHQLHKKGIRILPRVFAEHAHSKTGIDIHPGAEIGKSFFIDHGTGIVIGETTTIGNDVKIYQGVTLGALNVSKAYACTKRHPTIEDNVVIYSGATILGGDTIIGSNSIIGGNVWLTYSVPQHSVVYHKSEIKIKDNNPFPEPLNFVI